MSEKLKPFLLPTHMEEELANEITKKFRGQVPKPDTPVKVRQFVNGWLLQKYKERRLPRVYVDYVDIIGSKTQITLGTPR